MKNKKVINVILFIFNFKNAIIVYNLETIYIFLKLKNI